MRLIRSSGLEGLGLQQFFLQAKNYSGHSLLLDGGNCRRFTNFL